MATQIYVFEFQDKIKIGHSKNPEKRLKQIENMSGQKATNIFVITADFSCEKEIHRALREFRTIGEYFNYSFDQAKLLVESICKIAEERISSRLYSFNPLWKLLTKRGMKRKNLRMALGFSSSTMTKMSRNENVSYETLHRLCTYFDCRLCGILEFPGNKWWENCKWRNTD